MKKPLLITIIILVLVLALPFINFLRWSFQEKMPIEIVILDKTVPTLERINHKSLIWVLNNGRFVKKEKKNSYSFRKDYYGFAPTRPLKDRGNTENEYHLSEMLDLPEKADAVYFADTYGVFFNDWYAGVNKSRRSRKIYGGLNNTDYLLVNEMKNRNKLIILEYNSFDYPTPAFESFRTQEKLGITFSGWSGKYFEKLDSTAKNFPVWMTAMYRKEYKKPWTFTKPGIVLLSEKSIIVMEEGTHLTNGLPFIITDEANCEKYGVPESVAFNKWFDIIDPLQSNVISRFHFETTAIGDTLLSGKMLMKDFPAVIQEPSSQRIYYFSGDFASNQVNFCASRIKGFDKLKGILYSDKPDDTRRFFWLYYKPLLNKILTDYYTSLNELK
ncbi:MAG: hypothetical protein A2V46_13825 [Bacteroidetes bacterium RBG_19FT_COMBO_42_7]|nr:MAG: hypothetical protein A2Y71_11750 [Bacteroidetes bacterium RBG_13_42_15]OFY76366.1 MAG: hypothetical protein A2V46_13825 [Bacteroidetes bacterium RBG_19FT_COMBO_42_7]